MRGAIPIMIGEATVKRLSAKPTELKCPACNGTGFMAVLQSAKTGRRIYPPSCRKCNGKGRITKAAH
jgi:DnaJ-class molecular chaperone